MYVMYTNTQKFSVVNKIFDGVESWKKYKFVDRGGPGGIVCTFLISQHLLCFCFKCCPKYKNKQRTQIVLYLQLWYINHTFLGIYNSFSHTVCQLHLKLMSNQFNVIWSCIYSPTSCIYIVMLCSCKNAVFSCIDIKMLWNCVNAALCGIYNSWQLRSENAALIVVTTHSNEYKRTPSRHSTFHKKSPRRGMSRTNRCIRPSRKDEFRTYRASFSWSWNNTKLIRLPCLINNYHSFV